MKRLIASAVLLSVTLVATALFIGTSSSALAAGTLTVDKPNYTDYGPLVAGMTYFIQWTPGNAGATVKIELLKAGKRTKWVTTKTANDGEFIWKIPKSVKKNSKYKIKITSTRTPAFMTEVMTLSPSTTLAIGGRRILNFFLSVSRMMVLGHGGTFGFTGIIRIIVML